MFNNIFSSLFYIDSFTPIMYWVLIITNILILSSFIMLLVLMNKIKKERERANKQINNHTKTAWLVFRGFVLSCAIGYLIGIFALIKFEFIYVLTYWNINTALFGLGTCYFFSIAVPYLINSKTNNEYKILSEKLKQRNEKIEIQNQKIQMQNDALNYVLTNSKMNKQ